MPYVLQITRKEEDDIRILIRHALEDMEYGGGGTYTLDAGTDDQRADEKSIERAKRGIATIARLLEALRK
jgi:hypothetical protein